MTLAMLRKEFLEDDEVLITEGARKAKGGQTSGYLKEWSYSVGPSVWSKNFSTRLAVFMEEEVDILSMDAVPLSFVVTDPDDAVVSGMRDFRKALTGFANLPPHFTGDNGSEKIAVVSSGLWGCGAFRRNPVQMVLLQVLASRLASVLPGPRRLAASRRGPGRTPVELLISVRGSSLRPLFESLWRKFEKLNLLGALVLVFSEKFVEEANDAAMKAGRMERDVGSVGRFIDFVETLVKKLVLGNGSGRGAPVDAEPSENLP